MNTRNHSRSAGRFSVLLVACGSIVGCSSAPRGIDDNPSTHDPSTIPPGETPAVTMANAVVSECGGFAALEKSTLSKRIMTEADPTTDGGSSRCGETLKWSYDVEGKRLSLQDVSAVLNCCGEHGISATYDASANSLVVNETDAPLHGDRCLCQCMFDFAVDVLGLAGPTVGVQLVRHVTDSGDPKTVWSGTIELTAGSGAIRFGNDAPSLVCAGH